MAEKSGVGAKTLVAFGDEASWGNATGTVISDMTGPAPNALTKKCEILSEGITGEIGSLVSEALNPARAVSKRVQGTKAVGGEVAVELSNDGFMTFIRHAVGKLCVLDVKDSTNEKQYGQGSFTADAATNGFGDSDGTNPYLIIPRDSDDTNYNLASAPYGLEEGLSIMVGRDMRQIAANMGKDSTQPVFFYYTGMKVNQWTITANPGEIVRSTFDFMGKGEWLNDGSTVNATGDGFIATTPWNIAAGFEDGLNAGSTDPFTGFEGALTLDGTTEEVLGFTMTLNNNLAGDKYILGSQDRASLPEQNRSIEGTITMEFKNTSMYRKFLAGISAKLEVTFKKGSTERLKLTLPKVEFGGQTPTAGGQEAIVVELPYVALWDTTFDFTTIGDLDGANGNNIGLLPTDIVVEVVTASTVGNIG